MTGENSKKTPAGLPPSIQALEAAIVQAAAKPEAARHLLVKMTISGGLPEDRYEFSFEASGEGTIQCHMGCMPTKRKYKMRKAKMSAKDFANFLKKINVSNIMAASGPPVRIPPDSLVGRLEVSDGQNTVSAIFMADPGQAETAGFPMPPELAEVVDTIYDLAAKQLGAEKVRP